MTTRERVRQRERALAALEPAEEPAAAAVEVALDALARFDALAEGASAGLACAAGCASCCHYDVSASFPELLHLSRRLSESLPPQDLGALREALGRRGAELDALDPERRAAGGRPCVLLRDERCTAYEHRPLACRGWSSADASACRAALRDPLEPPSIPVSAVLRATAVDLARGVGDAARELGRDDAPLDLARALRDLLGREDEWAGRWAGGEALPPAWRSPRDPPRRLGADGRWRFGA